MYPFYVPYVMTTEPIDVVNGVEANYKNAVVRAYNAAQLKAEEMRNDGPSHPVDHSAQASLENSELTGTWFDTAYEEVWCTIYSLAGMCDTTDEMAKRLEQVRVELLRVTYDN
jgi:hypothetical protein